MSAPRRHVLVVLGVALGDVRAREPHLGAEPPPHRAELEPDHARADHPEPPRHRAERERADVVADDLVVDRHAGEMARLRPGGVQNEVLLRPLGTRVTRGTIALSEDFGGYSELE